MAIFADVKTGNDFEKCPEGTFQAVITNVYDIGVHPKKDSKTGEFINKHQIVILYEINKRIQTGDYQGQRFCLSQFYNLSMTKKSNLRKLVETLVYPMNDDDAKTFDLEGLRSVNCQTKIEHRGEYVNITNVAPLMEGVSQIEPELTSNHCPKWITEKRAKAINQGITIAEANSHEQNWIIDSITNHKSSGLINDGDIKNTIFSVCKKAIPIEQVDNESLVIILERLERIASLRSQDGGKK